MRTRALAAAGLAAAMLAGCAPAANGPVTLRFWAMGREGEVVTELVRDFEREHPGIRVRVQQIPWSAAHEKLLTSFVGDATPDLAQLGNTWIPELGALGALEPLDPWMARSTLRDTSYFRGIWDTNIVDGKTLGVPWYVDTRLLFYRRDLFARAGYATMPGDWAGWRAALAAVKRQAGRDGYALFLPPNEFEPLLVMALSTGATMLADHGTRGAFRAPEFRRAFAFYAGLYRDGLAPPLRNNEVSNMYQEFARGYFASYITGPWNLGEFANRLPPEMQDKWATAPMPGPDGPATGRSMAGGSSLVMFHRTRHPAETWQLIEFLSRPEQQVRFYHLTGDLPARREAWRDTAFTTDPRVRAFGEQLARTAAMPQVPEWELIANRLRDYAERVVRGGANIDSTLAALDRDVDQVLEKRRWILSRAASHPTTAGVGR